MTTRNKRWIQFAASAGATAASVAAGVYVDEGKALSFFLAGMTANSALVILIHLMSRRLPL